MTAAAAPPAPPARPGLQPRILLRLLLLFIPVAAAAELLHWGGPATFVCAALAIVPLAGLMGEATEHLASRLGAGIGGLLNATFGNAAELIIALVALSRGLHDVVKASLTGSIIGNVLLVLGAAIVAGGVRRERQRFDRAAAAAGATLLGLAAIALLVPTVFHGLGQAAVQRGAIDPVRETGIERTLSLEIAIVLFVVYALSLVFSLRTHAHLYAGQPGHGDEAGAAPAAAATAAGAHGGRRAAILPAVLTLLVATGMVAWMSELLVGAVEEASHALGLTEVFVGVIVVAIIGNAAEHSTAILVAMKDQMDLAMNIAIGSSIQIALFVAPVLLFVSHLMPGRPLDFLFTPFEVLAVVLSVWTVAQVSQDGESHWLEGVLMLAVYVVLGLAFYFLPA